MQRMRTVKEAFAEIKAQDESTALTLYGLQGLVKNGAIPSVGIGRKRLVNMQTVEEYLKGNFPTTQTNIVGYGKIRKVGS